MSIPNMRWPKADQTLSITPLVRVMAFASLLASATGIAVAQTRTSTKAPAATTSSGSTAKESIYHPPRAAPNPATEYSSIRPPSIRLRNEQAIAPFLRKLSQPLKASVNIVQIGDSHTAGDFFTGGWRNSLQLRYGPGGRGLLPVGRPYNGYVTFGVTARQSANWTTNTLLGARYSKQGPALGITGFTQTTSHPGATATLTADSSAYNFDNFAFCGLTGPDMGTVKARLGQTEQTFSFFAQQPGTACYEITSPLSETTAALETLEAKTVSLTSWETRRRSGGIILSNLGVVSAQLQHFARTDDAVVERELKISRPDLLIIAYGTNEGFYTDLSPERAAAVLRGQVQRLRRLLGYDVPVLLIGPPDVTTTRPEIALPSLPETVRCEEARYVPANIARIKAVQVQIANELKLAFWDWQEAMGGPCSSSAWVAQGLQRADHIHFNAAGGMRLGQALAADLDDARGRLNEK